jgi:hypothetical protein
VRRDVDSKRPTVVGSARRDASPCSAASAGHHAATSIDVTVELPRRTVISDCIAKKLSPRMMVCGSRDETGPAFTPVIATQCADHRPVRV